MLRILDRDLDARVFGEVSKLSSRSAAGIRLNPLAEVTRQLASERAKLLVLKPLVESQNAPELLEAFSDSTVLWMYRDYRDVAGSNLEHFGLANGVANLRPIADGAPGNWRSERVPDELRKLVRESFAEDMNPYDAAVLFWLVRNNFFFELGLDVSPAVRICRYEDLAASPVPVVEDVYRAIGRPFPGPRIVKEVHCRSVGRGRDIRVSPEIDRLARGLLNRLDAAYRSQQAARGAPSQSRP